MHNAKALRIGVKVSMTAMDAIFLLYVYGKINFIAGSLYGFQPAHKSSPVS
jgi:hypothetical protein